MHLAATDIKLQITICFTIVAFLHLAALENSSILIHLGCCGSLQFSEFATEAALGWL